MKTYAEYLHHRANCTSHNSIRNAVDKLAYKVCCGEFRGVPYETPRMLQDNLSRVILLSEETEKQIQLSAIEYIDYIHNEQSS